MISFSYTPSALQMFTVAGIKIYLNIPADVTEWDDTITKYIKEAQQWAEQKTSRLIGVCECEHVIWKHGAIITLDGLWFPLKYGKLIEVTEVFAYQNDDWVSIWESNSGDVTVEISTLTEGRIKVSGISEEYSGLKVVYTCGHVSGADIPNIMLSAIRRYIYYLYNPGRDQKGQDEATQMLKPIIRNQHGKPQ